MCCLPTTLPYCYTATLISYLPSIKPLLPYILSLLSLRSLLVPHQVLGQGDSLLSCDGVCGVLVKLFVVEKVCLSSSALLCINFELILSVVTSQPVQYTTQDSSQGNLFTIPRQNYSNVLLL